MTRKPTTSPILRDSRHIIKNRFRFARCRRLIRALACSRRGTSASGPGITDPTTRTPHLGGADPHHRSTHRFPPLSHIQARRTQPAAVCLARRWLFSNKRCFPEPTREQQHSTAAGVVEGSRWRGCVSWPAQDNGRWRWRSCWPRPPLRRQQQQHHHDHQPRRRRPRVPP